MSQRELLSHVTEYQIMYTTNITQKLKSWVDGKLRFYKFNNKAQIYSEDNVLVGQEFLKNEKKLQESNWQEEFKIGGLLVTIDSIISESVRDISKVFTKSHENLPKTQSSASSPVRTTLTHKVAVTESSLETSVTVKRRKVGLSRPATPLKLRQARSNSPIPEIISDKKEPETGRYRSISNVRENKVSNSAKNIKPQTKTVTAQERIVGTEDTETINNTLNLPTTHTKEKLEPQTIHLGSKVERVTSKESIQISPSLNKNSSFIKGIAHPIEKRPYKLRDVISPIHVKVEQDSELLNEADESMDSDQVAYVTWDFGNNDDKLLKDLRKPLNPAVHAMSTTASPSRNITPNLRSDLSAGNQGHQNVNRITNTPSRSRGLRIARPEREIIRVAAPSLATHTPIQKRSNDQLAINIARRPLVTVATPIETPKRKALQPLNTNSVTKLALGTPSVRVEQAVMTPVSTSQKRRISVYTGDSDDSIEDSQTEEGPSKVENQGKLTQTETYNFGNSRGYRISELDNLL